MPRSEAAWPLSAAVIEAAHDEGIAFTWPGIEPVQRGTCRDINLLHSAARQPFQECYGQEMYPSIEAKAAYLFYHLTTSHVFGNGNKRTAVLCLDTFLLQNGRYLLLDNDQMYKLARLVARSGEKGLRPHHVLQRVRRILVHNAPPIKALRKLDESFYRRLHRHKWWLRRAPKNQVDFPLRQQR